mgnify:CR=1 FL=1
MPDFMKRPKIIEQDGVKYGRIEESFELSVKPLSEEAKKKVKANLAEHRSKRHDDDDHRYILRPKIEAIHNGLTRNKTFYLSDKLRGTEHEMSGIHSWTHPYEKPVLKNHDLDTEPLGRVERAYFVQSSEKLAKKSAVVVIPRITDPVAIEKFLDGRYQTVSIGANTDSVVCSVCGTDLLNEEFCGHQRGETYDGVEAHWIIGEVWFDEISVVNQPSDIYAGVTDVGELAVAEFYMEDTAATNESVVDLSSNKSVSVNEAFNSSSLINNNIPSPNTEESDEGKEDNDLPEDKNKAPQNEEENGVNEQEEVENQEEGAQEPEVDNENPEVDNEDEPSEDNQESAEDDIVVQALKEKLQRVQKELKQLKEDYDELEENFNTVKTENVALTEQIEEYGGKIHRTLAEEVVDAKIALGMDIEDKEEAVSEHMTRSSEILEASLDDLNQLLDVQGGKPDKDNYEQVENPGAPVGDQPGDEVEGQENVQEDEDDEPELSEEQAINGTADMIKGWMNLNPRK